MVTELWKLCKTLEVKNLIILHSVQDTTQQLAFIIAPWAPCSRYSSFILIAQGFPNHGSQGPPIYPQLHMRQTRSVSIHHKGTSSPDFLSLLSLQQLMWPNFFLCGQLGQANFPLRPITGPFMGHCMQKRLFHGQAQTSSEASGIH